MSKKSPDPKKNAGIGLRQSLIDRLKAQAEDSGVSYSQLCQWYLEDGLSGEPERDYGRLIVAAYLQDKPLCDDIDDRLDWEEPPEGGQLAAAGGADA